MYTPRLRECFKNDMPHSTWLLVAILTVLQAAATCPPYVGRFPYDLCLQRQENATCSVHCDRPVGYVEPVANFTAVCFNGSWAFPFQATPTCNEVLREDACTIMDNILMECNSTAI